MTQNQIAFYKAKQEAEHWNRSDVEAARHNQVTEMQGYGQLETQQFANEQLAEHYIRSDAINKSHYERTDFENQRHNVASESLQHESNVINQERNWQQYELGQYSNETERAYKVGTLTNETNKTRSQIALNQSNIELNSSKVGVNNSQQLVNLDAIDTNAVKREQMKAETKKLESDVGLNAAKAKEAYAKAEEASAKTYESTMKGHLNVAKTIESITNSSLNVGRLIPLVGRLIG